MEKKLFVQFPEEGTETDGSKQKSSDGEQYKNSEVFYGNGCFACINSGIRGSTPAVG